MKKNLLVFISAAITLFSCAKTDGDKIQNESGQNKVNVENYVNYSFGVGTEVAPENLKTSLESEDVKWVEGDQIKVFWGLEDTDCAVADVVDNMITISAPEGIIDFYAVYPADAASLVDADGVHHLLVTVPSSTNGSWSAANIMVSRVDEDGNFTFEHAVSWLKVGVNKDKTTSLKVRPNVAGQYLSGTVEVGFDGSSVDWGNAVITGVNQQYSTSGMNVDNGSNIYIPVLPGSEFELGIGFTMTDKQSGSSALTGALTTAAVSLPRATMMSVTSPQAKPSKWFVKQGGTGDGSSWDNAAGEELIVKLLGKDIIKNGEKKGEYEGYTNGWRIHNGELYIAAGTYNLTMNGGPVTMNFKDQTNFKIIGGYSADITGTSTDSSLRNYETNIVKFTGGGSTILRGEGAFLRTWPIYGISFDDLPANLNGDAAVLYLDGDCCGGTSSDGHTGITFNNCSFCNNILSVPLVKAAFKTGGSDYGKINFTDCVISGNESTSTASLLLSTTSKRVQSKFTNCTIDGNDISGSVINVASPDLFSLTTCTFTNNKAGAPVVYVSGTSNNKSVIIKDCTFTDNVSSAKSGGALRINKAVSLDIEGCSFVRNSATGDGSTGGAVWLSTIGASGSKQTISDCTFEGNTAIDQGGALRTETSYLTISECSFTGNHCGGQAGAYNIASSSVVDIVDCDFENNTSDGAGGAVVNVTGIVTITGGKFVGNSALHGGALAHRGTAATHTLLCSNVLFDGNSSTIDPVFTTAEKTAYTSADLRGGGAISNIVGTSIGIGPADFVNCKFINNTSVSAGGAVFLNGKSGSVPVYGFSKCVFSTNAGHTGADIFASQYAKVYVDQSSFTNYRMTSTTNNSQYYAFSVGSAKSTVEMGINNSSFGNSVKKYAGCVVGMKGPGVLVNSSIFDRGTQLLRPDDSNGNYIINNFLVHSEADGNPINQKSGTPQHGYYNLLKAGKNAYATIAETDDNYGDVANVTHTWTTDSTSGQGYWVWTLSNVTISHYATAAEVGEKVSTNFSAFDTWLKKYNTNPYAVDQLGNSRNPNKLQKGAYDTGLAD